MLAELSGQLQWIYRPTQWVDYGIDGHVELSDADGRPDGAYAAVQIKSGPSQFTARKRRGDEGWWFSFDDTHRSYWLAHVLPVYVVLVDTDSRACYWQRITAETCQPAGKRWKVLVPRAHDIASMQVAWRRDAERLRHRASIGYQRLSGALAPSVTRELTLLADTDTELASLLAAHLVEADSPEVVAAYLIDSALPWLNDAPPALWRVVGQYMVEHDLYDRGAESYLRAAERGQRTGEMPGVSLADAGLQLLNVDLPRAREVLRQAYAYPEARLRAAVGLTMADHGVDAPTPRPEPPELAALADQADRSPLVWAFRAQNAARLRDNDAAVGHWERCLSLRPDSSGIMLTLAESLVRRGTSADGQGGDLRRAEELAKRALEQRRQWRGPSAEALAQYLKLLLFASDFRGVLWHGCVSPVGTALPHEATDPTVLFSTTRAALAEGRTDLAEELLAALPPSIARRHLEVDILASRGDEDAVCPALHALVDEALAAEEYEAASIAVLKLAERGDDASARLAPLTERNIVPASLLRLMSARSVAARDLDAALPDLRQLAVTDASAAEALIDLLCTAGRIDQALTEWRTLCVAPHVYVQGPSIVWAFMRAERVAEAEALAREVLLTGEFRGAERQRLLATLVAGARSRGDHREIARVCRDFLVQVNDGRRGTELDARETRFVWWLVEAELAEGRMPAAVAAVDQYGPSVNDPDQLRPWTAVHRYRGFDAASFTRGLELVTRFLDVDQARAGKLLTGLFVDRLGSEALPDVLAAALGNAMAGYQAKYGPPPGLIALPAETDEDIEALLGRLTPQLKAQAEAGQRARNAVQAGQPLGLLTLSSGLPYALAVIGRAAGYCTAATPDGDTYDLEVDTARRHLGAAVVIDTTALHLLAVLDRGTVLRAQFSEVLIADTARDDVLNTLMHARLYGGSSRSLGFDSGAERTYFQYAPSDDGHVLVERAAALEDEASGCRVGRLDGLPLFDDADIDNVGAWLGPLQLASNRGTALWSDDLGQRAVARGHDIPTFGTLALIDALQQSGRIADPVTDSVEVRRRLLAEWVLDLPYLPSDLHERAAADGYRDGPALAVLERPAFWANDPDAADTALDLLTSATDADLDLTERWLRAALAGLAAATGNPRSVGALAVTSTTAITSEVDVAIANAARAVAVAREVCASHGLGDPAEHLADYFAPWVEAGYIDDAEAVATRVHDQLEGSPPEGATDDR